MSGEKMDELSKEDIEKRLKELQEQMNQPDFWQDKAQAKKIVQKYEKLKEAKSGVNKYDKRGAVISIFAGAGGLDAEDFSEMLFSMYVKYVSSIGWKPVLLHKHTNDHGGIKNVSFEVKGKNVYGTLKNESGVHRLVRISPFNSAKQRHTSFAMVEVVPKMKKVGEVEVDESDLEISFSKSSGPGGQNVNKRETAVRILHVPTDIAVHVDSERSQERNKQKALEILQGKLYYKKKQEQKEKQQGFSLNPQAENEWGNQIRSYVLHPYKLVKDHRTEEESQDVEGVFAGDIQSFIEAEEGIDA